MIMYWSLIIIAMVTWYFTGGSNVSRWTYAHKWHCVIE